MQSTGQTSTQAVSFVSIQGSVMMNGILGFSVRMFGVSRTRWAESDGTGSGDAILSKTAILRQSLYSTHEQRNAAKTWPAGHQRKRRDERRPAATGRHQAVHAVAGVRWMRRFDRPRRIARARGPRR